MYNKLYKNKKMKTTELVVAKSTLVTGGYRSPEVIVTEIFNEGVLCISGPDNEGWKEETPEW